MKICVASALCHLHVVGKGADLLNPLWKRSKFCLMRCLLVHIDLDYYNIITFANACFSFCQGVKEVTLLGQNVNSYRDLSVSSLPVIFSTETNLSKGFSTIYRTKEGGRRFADLLYHVSKVS